MSRRKNRTLGTIAKVAAVLFLLVPTLRLGQVAYRLLSQGPLAALGEMARGAGGFSDNLASARWSGVILEFTLVMLLYALVGLALLWMAKRMASDGRIERQEARKHSL